MTKTYRITPRALQDLKNIGRYTQKEWGNEQRNKYLNALKKRFEWLAENPQMGLHRSEIREGYFCYIQAVHLIFFLKKEGSIDIIGIPHQRMDIGKFFS